MIFLFLEEVRGELKTRETLLREAEKKQKLKHTKTQKNARIFIVGTEGKKRDGRGVSTETNEKKNMLIIILKEKKKKNRVIVKTIVSRTIPRIAEKCSYFQLAG